MFLQKSLHTTSRFSVENVSISLSSTWTNGFNFRFEFGFRIFFGKFNTLMSSQVFISTQNVKKPFIILPKCSNGILLKFHTVPNHNMRYLGSMKIWKINQECSRAKIEGECFSWQKYFNPVITPKKFTEIFFIQNFSVLTAPMNRILHFLLLTDPRLRIHGGERSLLIEWRKDRMWN